SVLSARPWSDRMRLVIEKLFDLKACDIYGLSELMGPGVAGESVETQDGSHIWEDHFRPEIIDPISEKVLKDGEHGELVFTTHTREALPIIRCRTHDLTSSEQSTARPGPRRMKRVTGSSDDMISLRGVNIFPTQIEEIALEIETLAPHFTLEIARPNRMDELTIKIERRETSTLEEAEVGGKELQARIKTRVGCSCKLEIVEPHTLTRSSGKLRRIYDLRELND